MSAESINHSVKMAPCPRCGAAGKRHSTVSRSPRGEGGMVLAIVYSKHYCAACRKYFSRQIPGLTEKRSQYTVTCRKEALRLMAAGKTLDVISRRLKVPSTTLHDWKSEKNHARVSALQSAFAL